MSGTPARILTAAAILATAALVACSSEEDRFAQHLENAAEYRAEGSEKEALIELRSALQIRPKDADVNYRIGELLLEQARYVDAAFFFREAARLDPSRVDALLMEARLLLFDDTDRAEELIEIALEREPDNPMVHIRRSELALERADAAKALESALTAVELAPEDPMAHMQLGIVRQGQIRELQLERKEVPDAAYEEAITSFRRADELFDGAPKARVEMARVYASWGRHERAAKTFREAIESADETEQRLMAANAAVQYGLQRRDYDLLRWSLEQVVAIAPEEILAWAQLAAIEEQLEPGAGEAVWRRLVARRPADPEAHGRLAGYLASRDRLDEAVAHLRENAETMGEPFALEQIVVLRLRDGDVEAARAAVDELASEYPEHARTALARGRLALAEGRPSEAIEHLRRFVGSEESDEGQRLLALAEFRRGNLPAAQSAIDAALQLRREGSRRDLLRLKSQILLRAEEWNLLLATLRALDGETELTTAERLMAVRALYGMNRDGIARRTLEELLEAPVESENERLPMYLEFARHEMESQPDRARELLDRVLAARPRHPGAIQLAVEDAVRTEDPQRALAVLSAAAERGPLPPSLLILRGRVHLAAGDHARAEEDARRAFAAAPSSAAALDLLTQVYAAQDRLDEAIDSFREAEAVGALPQAGQVIYARLLLTAGEREEARALYEKIVEANPSFAGAKNDLAWMLANGGEDLERALILAQEAQQLLPESHHVADTLGYVYFKKGLQEAAIEQLRYAIQLAGEEAPPLYHYHLGLAFRAAERNQEAVQAFERALADGEDFAEAEAARREIEAAKASAAAGSS